MKHYVLPKRLQSASKTNSIQKSTGDANLDFKDLNNNNNLDLIFIFQHFRTVISTP